MTGPRRRSTESERVGNSVAGRPVNVVQRILNWFALGLMLLGAAALLLGRSHILPPALMLVATVPLLVQLFAHASSGPVGLRLVAMALNWVGAVLAGSLAAAALTGIGGAFAISPFLSGAALLYGWNAASVAMASA
jgi:FtsH-binding integral membrane protein